LGDVETTDVENFNGILRERLGRLVRRTKCFAKVKATGLFS
jgi:IS1 family transposase